MTESSHERTASCCCEQLKVNVRGDPIRLAICHCYACQRRTGSVFGEQGRFLDEQLVNIEGKFSTYVRTGDSGGMITYKFCPDCGSTICWTLSGLPGFTIIAVGAFADQNIGTPVFSVYEDRKHAWVELPVNIEHMD